MKIIVSGEAKAYDQDSYEEIVDASRLTQLDGLAYSKERCADYLDDELLDLGIIGGEVRLSYDAEQKQLRVISEYHAPQPLSRAELTALVDATEGQWSDGIGEGAFLHRRKLKIDLDLYPGETKTRAEQVDDGKKVKPHRLFPLHKAIREGKLTVARELLAQGAKVDAKNRHGSTPLHIACDSVNSEAALLLLEHRANVNAADRNGATPLASLALAENAHEQRCVGIAQALVQHGARVDCRDSDDYTPLMWAANRGKLLLMVYFIHAGADVNARGGDKYNLRTPLTMAQGKAARQLLLKHGATPEVESSHPAQTKLVGNSKEIVAFIRESMQGKHR